MNETVRTVGRLKVKNGKLEENWKRRERVRDWERDRRFLRGSLDPNEISLLHASESSTPRRYSRTPTPPPSPTLRAVEGRAQRRAGTGRPQPSPPPSRKPAGRVQRRVGRYNSERPHSEVGRGNGDYAIISSGGGGGMFSFTPEFEVEYSHTWKGILPYMQGVTTQVFLFMPGEWR
jgi:hypothetical protein